MAESAFAALADRHGPMVRRVCRSLLDDPNDAEDAFQAAFLVLARKAGSLRRPELGQLALRDAQYAARKLRRQAARRRKHEGREARKPGAKATEADHVESHALPGSRRRPCSRKSPDWRGPCRDGGPPLRPAGPVPRTRPRPACGCSDRTLRRRLKQRVTTCSGTD